jgi:hypothetical protein
VAGLNTMSDAAATMVTKRMVPWSTVSVRTTMTIGMSMMAAISSHRVGVARIPPASLPSSKSPAKILSTSPRR